MIHLGIIGTNWITDQFVQAAHETKRYQLVAVYSRKLATAQRFGEKYGDIEYATDLATFFWLSSYGHGLYRFSEQFALLTSQARYFGRKKCHCGKASLFNA